MNPVLHYKRLWLIIGYLLIGYIFYSSLRPDPIEIDVAYFDKYAHTFAYFTVMGWFAQIYHRKQSVWICAATFTLMGIGIEILQGMGGVRYFDYYDMLANASGVLIAWVLSTGSFKNILSYFDQKLGQLNTESN